MKHSVTFRIIGFLLFALVSYNYYACKKVDLERIPMVKVVSIAGITSVSADVSGEVVDAGEGDINEYGFAYGTGDYPTVNDQKIVKPGSMAKGIFSLTLSDLTPNTEYNIRGYFVIAGEYVYSDVIRSFLTLNIAERPTVVTADVVDIGSSNAVSGGEVTSDGGASVTARGVCWSQTVNPTINDTKTIDGSGTGSFVSNITGLAQNTTYYLRAYATNVAGTSYGSEKTFTTQSGGGPLYEWLKYDNGTNFDFIGFSGYNFDAIVRFPANELQPFQGWKITKFRFYPNSTTSAVFTLEIYQGENPDIFTPFLFEEIPNVSPGQWNEYILQTPFVIPDNLDIWIGYYVQNYFDGEYPAGCDEGPAVTGFGDLFYDYTNNQWSALSILPNPVSYNWNIEVFITNELGVSSIINPLKFRKTKKKDIEIPAYPGIVASGKMFNR